MTANPGTVPPWTPATSIMDMPIEVLREILISVDGEFSRTLWSLCLTCRHFRNIVEEHCEPEYNLRGKFIEDPFAMMEQLRDRPHLRRLLRSVRIEYNEPQHRDYTEKETLPLLTHLGLESYRDIMSREWGDILQPSNGGPVWLVASLPNIETIELVTCDHYVPMMTLLQDFGVDNRLKSHGFQKLRNLDLTTHDYHEEIYLPVLNLPSLRTVQLSNGGFADDVIDDRHWGTSHVTKVNIRVKQRMFSFPTVDLGWQTFERLKVLHLHIDRPYIAYDWDLERPLFVECLSTQALSLEILHIYSNEEYVNTSSGSPIEISCHCPGQSSFRPFLRLKSLVLTDMSLMGVSQSGPAHWHQPVHNTLSHLAAMFPSKLETFTHLIWEGPSIFDKMLTRRGQSLRSWDRIWKAADKNQFPSLRSVMVQKYGPSGLSKERETIWQRGS